MSRVGIGKVTKSLYKWCLKKRRRRQSFTRHRNMRFVSRSLVAPHCLLQTPRPDTSGWVLFQHTMSLHLPRLCEWSLHTAFWHYRPVQSKISRFLKFGCHNLVQRNGDRPIIRPLPKCKVQTQKKRRHNSVLEWNSNLWSKCSSDRRQKLCTVLTAVTMCNSIS
jgi:hypothetical protein